MKRKCGLLFGWFKRVDPILFKQGLGLDCKIYKIKNNFSEIKGKEKLL